MSNQNQPIKFFRLFFRFWHTVDSYLLTSFDIVFWPKRPFFMNDISYSLYDIEMILIWINKTKFTTLTLSLKHDIFTSRHKNVVYSQEISSLDAFIKAWFSHTSKVNHFSWEEYKRRPEFDADKNFKNTELNKQMVELKSLSTLPKSTSVEIQMHSLSTNCNDNGELKYKKGHLSDHWLTKYFRFSSKSWLYKKL